MFVVSLLLGGLILCPLILSAFFPYFWTDLVYHTKLLGILLKFVSRRRRRPLFLALDRFLEQVETRPNKTFIVFENKRYSFKDTDKESNRIANALRVASVVNPGDTAALFLLNEPAFIFCWLALAKLGCACALLNSSIRARSLVASFSCCRGAKVLIASEELQGAVEEVYEDLQQEGLTTVFITSEELRSSRVKSLTRAAQESSDAAVPQTLRANVSFTSPAVYIYTSGTTGLPKAAVINQTRLLAGLSVLASNGVTHTDVIYVTLPLYHTASFFMGLLGSIETESAKELCVYAKALSRWWKGENVATTEVSEILLMLDSIEAANVYGVKVSGHGGRVGMAALKLTDGMEFAGSATYEHVKNLLPAYARPRFIRIQDELDVTGTFKQVKGQLVKEGFDPNLIQNKLFFLDESKQTFVPMTEEIYSSIIKGHMRL
ncbi:long-chain fatty acid transport protein 2 [Garra rufa]|uniref:long-chain fatty acid transport protein 2 n=1 Tax=Garra rufa TaxID=137080 RepID=UPI003CCE591B